MTTFIDILNAVACIAGVLGLVVNITARYQWSYRIWTGANLALVIVFLYRGEPWGAMLFTCYLIGSVLGVICDRR